IAPRWLDNPILAFGLVVCAAIWKELGYNIVFYLAALQNIPGELTEAAAIDGANAWQRFRSITLPLLSPITFFLVFTNLAYAFFEVFGRIDILTGNLGFAGAQGVILLFIVGVITLLQFRYGNRNVHYGGG
ncbi:MAG: ABC transporter permease subunit, partial [Deinococcales bacterium]